MRWLLAALLLAGCTAQPPVVQPTAALPRPTESACHSTPDGAPPPAPSPAPPPAPLADRGIGGTGAPTQTGVQTADRGIGGTGIVGVITGFGSVCLADEEVAIPPGLTPKIDGQPASVADLRAGQFAAVAASPANQAFAIDVSHLVIGPVQARPAPDTLVVAGQIVHTEHAAGTGAAAALGQWVAVSGLPMPDGTIAATRIDPAPAGRVLLHGNWPSAYGAARIGNLDITLPPGAVPPTAGFPVIVTGTLVGDALLADGITADPAADNPALYFPPQIDSFVVESYVAVISGGLLLDHAFVTGRDFGRIGATDRGITRFRRGADGRLVGTGLRGLGRVGGFGPAALPGGAFNGGRGGPEGGFGSGGLGGFRSGALRH